MDYVITCQLIDFLRDHRKLFIGDARGRVFTWSVADSQGIKECALDTSTVVVVRLLLSYFSSSELLVRVQYEDYISN